MSALTAANIARWRGDPVAFIEEMLVDPETDAPFVLSPAQRRFLKRAFTLTPDGRLRYPELVFSAPKKSGKTGLGAMITLYVVLVLGGRFAEGYCVANDLEQAQGRVFQAISRIVQASPALTDEATVTASKITFSETGATISAIASDFAGAAGANPTITVFDELWGVTTERGHRLWDEMVPPPTRRIACRVTVTYAGFEGESVLLEGLYKRGLQGEQVEPDLYEQPGMLMFWTHDFTAPWQTEEWREQMRGQLRPNGYLRLIENRWVTSESTFIDMGSWDECTDQAARPMLADLRLPIWVGIDASVKRDSTAIVAVAWDDEHKAVRLVTHRTFHPSPAEPLDFEGAVEATVLDLVQRFRVQEVRFDPYQMQAVAQRLAAQHVPMQEFPQSTSNLTEASTNLYELIKAHNLVVYPDDSMRLAVQRSIAIETPRGWRIAKEKASHKIDVVVALAMASLGAVQGFAASAAPALWRRDHLLADGAPVPMPPHCDAVFAVAVVTDRGEVGVVYFARNMHSGVPLVLLDCGVTPLSPASVEGIVADLRDLAAKCRARAPVLLFASSTLIDEAQRRGYGGEPIDKLIAMGGDLAFVAATHIVAQRVKATANVLERSRQQPLGSLLDATAKTATDPLRLAALCGVVLALDDGTTRAAA